MQVFIYMVSDDRNRNHYIGNSIWPYDILKEDLERLLQEFLEEVNEQHVNQ